MRICLVSKEVAGVRGGGIGTYVAEAGPALTAAGHDVTLVTAEAHGDESRDEQAARRQALAGFTTVLAVEHEVDAVDDEAKRLFHGQPTYGYALRVHERLRELEPFDYIEFADYQAEGVIAIQEQRLFSTYGNTVLGLTLHSPSYECWADDRQTHRMDRVLRETVALEDHAIRHAPLRWAPSLGMREAVSRRLGLPEDETAILRYPMRFAEAPPAPPAPRTALEDLRFLYFGRIEPRKGVVELIEAFRRMPSLRLTMVGGDLPFSPYGRSMVEWLRRRLPPNVEILPPLARPAMLERLARTDVCIFPSILENWPNVCIESMGASRVVIGSRWGGMGEMIEHGTSGFVVDGRDPADIVRVVQHDLRDALPRLDAIGTAAAARIRELSRPATYARELERLVQSTRDRLAEARPHATPTSSRRVSIIVPFYEDAATIDETVGTALAQDHADVEVLIVDDGSPLADADAILSRLEQRDARVRVVRKPNGGLSSARNEGIRHATGDYVLFCDADNLLRSNYASLGAELLDRHAELDWITPNMRLFDDRDGRDHGIYNPLPFDRSTALLANRFGDAGSFFRRSAFTERGLAYDELLICYEDWALWLDADRLEIPGTFVPRVAFEYRVRPGSMMTRDGWPFHVDGVALLIERHLQVDSDADRALIVSLNQEWGPAAIERLRPGGGSLRHTAADKLVGVLRRVPGAYSTLRAVIASWIRVSDRLRGRR